MTNDNTAELSASSRPRTALIIDDSSLFRRVTSKMLKKLGFETFEACDGQVGLCMLRDRRYDLCICDVEMPVMDGIQCVSLLRQWERGNQALGRQYVLCASSRVDKLRHELMHAGMDYLLQKPFGFEQVQSHVKRCIEHSARYECATSMSSLHLGRYVEARPKRDACIKGTSAMVVTHMISAPA